MLRLLLLFILATFELVAQNELKITYVGNMGVLIEMEGKKIFHAGDADINENLFTSLNLETKDIDIAVLPNWLAMSEDGVKIVREFIKPKNIILTHISPDYAEFTKKEADENFPEAILFTTIRQGFIF